MADPAHEPRREQAAGDETARPGSAEKAEGAQRKTFAAATQGQEKTVETGARQKKCRAAEKRKDLDERAEQNDPRIYGNSIEGRKRPWLNNGGR
ncbi:hypothetical protein PPNSA23_32090 [Phyllobacterium phragmitis]|uniref:Uncharacterized protein n=1 Tax=Phyllobacterium phragmitis TaxID=2670329 RepID=A0ABQ0H2X0_9HYPH